MKKTTGVFRSEAGKFCALSLLIIAVRAGANKTIEIKPECKSIFMASLKGDAKIINNELRKGADPNCRDGAGQTALMLAVTNGPLAAALPLLKAGADPNAQDSAGKTALVFAAIQGRVDTVKALLRNGASLSLKDNDGMTALEAYQAASALPRAEVIRLLGGTSKSKDSILQSSKSRSWKKVLNESQQPANTAAKQKTR